LRSAFENGTLTIQGRIDHFKYEGLQPVYTEYNIGHYVPGLEEPATSLWPACVISLCRARERIASPQRAGSCGSINSAFGLEELVTSLWPATGA
jgi:hypothetical protein